MLLEKREEGRKDKEEDVSSYWMNLGKGEGTVNLQKKHWIAVCGEQVFGRGHGTVV
jgi:hypothetical protein